MKKTLVKILSVVLCLSLIFTVGATGAYAQEDTAPEAIVSEEAAVSTEDIAEYIGGAVTNGIKEVAGLTSGVFDGMAPLTSFDAFTANILKVLYNLLNVIVEVLVRAICLVYPKPATWKNISEYEGKNFLEGRETYQTSAKAGNHWSLGYSSKSVIPEDIDSGEYFISRDLLNKKALGVYDDQRIRVSVIDDNSGEGAVVVGAIDALGITSTDVRTVRESVLEYCAAKNIKVASINISATHCHSALDVQGVSTQFFYKFFCSGIKNAIGLDSLPFLEAPTYFKQFFIQQTIAAVKEAFEDMEDGTLSYSEIDASYYIKDKRELVSQEDVPNMVGICFEPDSGSEATYICNVTCHPTSFSASHQYVGSDYIYYMDKYIKEKTGANLVVVQGALGQMSRENINPDETGMTEMETWGSETRLLGETFAKFLLGGSYKKLAPILNVKHKEIFIQAENSILALACEIELVNNQVYILENGRYAIASELGYLEFGHEIGFAMFPGELYPEVFWGSEIIGGTNWDGTEWPYESLHNSVDGIKVYAMSLTNDAAGYTLTDNNFAFMGHIIGDSISDELLSPGKHIGSYYVSNYLELIEDYTK